MMERCNKHGHRAFDGHAEASALQSHERIRLVGAVLCWSCLALTVSSVATVDARAQTASDPNYAGQVTERPEVMLEPTGPSASFSLANLAMAAVRPTARPESRAEMRSTDVLSRKLWANRIQVPDPNEDAETRATLDHLIRQIRSMRFEKPKPKPFFSVPIDVAPVQEPKESPAMSEPPATEDAATPIEPMPETPGTLAADTLARVSTAVEDPNIVDKPLELAELLFLSGHTKEAAILYQKALELLDRQDVTPADDRAWILFQIGNCLRETDVVRARDTYLKVVADYPDCPWVDLAKAHGRLISWYQKAKPRQLIAAERP
jgi:tetratricopeptide (TPR) repeat protein